MTERPPAARVFLLAVACALAGLWVCSGFYHDDAFITLRYVDRLLAGHGLTWSDGDRVEGFTHPLWLGLIAGAGAVGAPLVTTSRVLGVAFVVLLFWIWWRSRVWTLPLLLVATLPGLLLWAWGGLETASLCAWLVAGAWLALRARDSAETGAPGAVHQAAGAGLAFAAAGLCRPEGVGAGLIAVGWIALSRRLGAVLAAGTGLVVPTAAWFAFRLGYYGDTVPNPAHVKAEGIPAAFQISSAGYYLLHSLTLWLPGFAAALAVLILSGSPRTSADSGSARSERSAHSGWFVAALAVPSLLSLVAGGGDHMPGARFLVPIVVLLAFAAAVSGSPATATRRRVATALVACGVIAQVVVLMTMPVKHDRAAAEGEPIGRFLETHLAPGSLVSTATAGSEAFFAPSLRFVDPLGLNDRQIAKRRITEFVTRWQVMPGHAKGDGAYVLSRRPDVVILGRARGYLGEDPKAWFLTDYELLSSETFRRDYRPWWFAVPLLESDAQRLGYAERPDSSPVLVLTAYLRTDSSAAGALAAFGTPLQPPWGEGAAPNRPAS